VTFGQDLELKYMEPKPGGQDRELIMRALAEDGYNLIIGVGFLYSDSLAKVAADFPDIHFGIIDGYIPDLNESSNITCLGFAEHEGSFLMGAVAGLMNKGGKVGFLGGMDIPLIHKFQGGFMAGAMYVNKALRQPGMILAQYCGKDPTDFNNPKMGESISVNFFMNSFPTGKKQITCLIRQGMKEIAFFLLDLPEPFINAVDAPEGAFPLFGTSGLFHLKDAKPHMNFMGFHRMTDRP